jgi:hypothetical protein
VSAFFSFLPRLFFLAMGCGLVLRAGRLEAAGSLLEARRSARQGGFLAALGALFGAASVFALPEGARHEREIAAGLLLASGFAALLAGLSGKPRPTGFAAAALLAAAIVVALAAVR